MSGKTIVMVKARNIYWDAENEQAHHWWLACSLSPENDNVGVCKAVDYVASWSIQIVNVDFADQAEVEYFTIRADGWLAIHQPVFPDSALETADSAQPGIGELVDSMYG